MYANSCMLYRPSSTLSASSRCSATELALDIAESSESFFSWLVLLVEVKWSSSCDKAVALNSAESSENLFAWMVMVVVVMSAVLTGFRPGSVGSITAERALKLSRLDIFPACRQSGIAAASSSADMLFDVAAARIAKLLAAYPSCPSSSASSSFA